jgi:hypothetical protein
MVRIVTSFADWVFIGHGHRQYIYLKANLSIDFLFTRLGVFGLDVDPESAIVIIIKFEWLFFSWLKHIFIILLVESQWLLN